MWRLFKRRKPTNEVDETQDRLAGLAQQIGESPRHVLSGIAVAMQIEWDLFIATYGSTSAFDEAPQSEKIAYLRKREGWQRDLTKKRDPSEAVACELVNLYLAAATANHRQNRQDAMTLIAHLLNCVPKK